MTASHRNYTTMTCLVQPGPLSGEAHRLLSVLRFVRLHSAPTSLARLKRKNLTASELNERAFSRTDHSRPRPLVKDALDGQVVKNGVNDLILQPCLSLLVPCFKSKFDLQAYLITATKFWRPIPLECGHAT